MFQIEKTCKKDKNFLKQIIDYLKDFQSIQQTKILIEKTYTGINTLKNNYKNIDKTILKEFEKKLKFEKDKKFFFQCRWSTINKYFRKNTLISLKFLKEIKKFLSIKKEKIENFQNILKIAIYFIDKKVKNHKNIKANKFFLNKEKR